MQSTIAIEKALYVSHNAPDALVKAGFKWAGASKKKKKKGGKKKK